MVVIYCKFFPRSLRYLRCTPGLFVLTKSHTFSEYHGYGGYNGDSTCSSVLRCTNVVSSDSLTTRNEINVYVYVWHVKNSLE